MVYFSNEIIISKAFSIFKKIFLSICVSVNLYIDAENSFPCQLACLRANQIRDTRLCLVIH